MSYNFRLMVDYKSNLSSINQTLWDIVHSVESSAASGMIAKEPVASYGSVMNDRFRLSSILQAGFRYTLFERLMSLMPFNLSDWSDILDMAPKTMARYKADDKTFRPIHAEKIPKKADSAIKRGTEMAIAPKRGVTR